MSNMESNCWYSFKDETGLPVLFYNSETGEHRWASAFKQFNMLLCSRASVDEIPQRYGEDPIIPQRKVKSFRNIATETDEDLFAQLSKQKICKNAETNTDHFFLDENTSFLEKLEKNKEKESLNRQEDVLGNSCDVGEQERFTRTASPLGNPFNVDSKEEDTIDHEYGQSKESLVHNLFAMELSSVLSYEDLQQNNCGDNQYGPNMMPGITLESNLDRDGMRNSTEMREFDPPVMKIKVESDQVQEEQTFGNADNTDFSLVDLLPKKQKRKHKCTICKTSFKTPSALERHMMFTHSDEMGTKPRPHACTICDKKFVEANCLRKHLRTHTGEKPYRCPFCGKGFAQSQNLNKHKYIHTGSRPHKCKVCGKTFRQHSHLSRHKLIHTGEKPYQCSECPKNYRTRSHLIRHFKSSKHQGLIDNSKKSLPEPMDDKNTFIDDKNTFIDDKNTAIHSEPCIPANSHDGN